MGGIIAAVVLIVVAIGFSAWWKGRLIGQGKIIQRASDFVEYAEIFTVRPIPNEEYAAALKALDLKKTGTSLEGNTKAVKFTGISVRVFAVWNRLRQTAYIALSLIAGKQNTEGLPLKMK